MAASAAIEHAAEIPVSAAHHSVASMRIAD
jgi:hypothetical protein